MARNAKRKKLLPVFNMYAWSREIPFADDLWLGMQARNLALVDMGFIRSLEDQALAAYFEHMKTPGMELTFLSAMSQMWIFALYEFLRTWRERGKYLIKIADEYQTVQPRKRAKFLAGVVEVAKGREKHVRVAPAFNSHYVAQIASADFIAGVRGYFEKTDILFKDIEGLRITLAKHEIPQGRGMVAEAPGYARMSYETGSLYWHFTNKEGTTERVERRVVANAFLEIGTTFSDQNRTEDDT